MFCSKNVISSLLLFLVILTLPFITVAATEIDSGPVTTLNSNNGGAKEQLLRMAKFLAQIKQFNVKWQSGYDVVQESGQKIEFAEQRDLTVARPARLKVVAQQSDGDKSLIVFNDKMVTVFDINQNVYATTAVKGNLDASIVYFVKDLQMRLPLAMLFTTSLPTELERRIQAAEVVETTELNGIECVHIAARSDTVDMQVWLPTESDPLPQRIVLTYKNERGEPQYWANFTHWDLSPTLRPKLFNLKLPPDAQRIEFLSTIPTMPHSPAAGAIKP